MKVTARKLFESTERNRKAVKKYVLRFQSLLSHKDVDFIMFQSRQCRKIFINRYFMHFIALHYFLAFTLIQHEVNLSTFKLLCGKGIIVDYTKTPHHLFIFLGVKTIFFILNIYMILYVIY